MNKAIGHNFYYHHFDGWKTVNFPVEQADDFKKDLIAMGFNDFPDFAIGDELGVNVEFYRRNDDKDGSYDYLVVFNTSSYGYNVFADDFPSAIEIFSKLSVIAQASVVTETYQALDSRILEEAERTDQARQQRKKEAARYMAERNSR